MFSAVSWFSEFNSPHVDDSCVFQSARCVLLSFCANLQASVSSLRNATHLGTVPRATVSPRQPHFQTHLCATRTRPVALNYTDFHCGHIAMTDWSRVVFIEGWKHSSGSFSGTESVCVLPASPFSIFHFKMTWQRCSCVCGIKQVVKQWMELDIMTHVTDRLSVHGQKGWLVKLYSL